VKKDWKISKLKFRKGPKATDTRQLPALLTVSGVARKQKQCFRRSVQKVLFQHFWHKDEFAKHCFYCLLPLGNAGWWVWCIYHGQLRVVVTQKIWAKRLQFANGIND